MGIEDEKTRTTQRAVKRAVPVAEQATRPVKAVRRRAAATLPEERLISPFRVQLLPRGELINAAGEADNGWVVREDSSQCLRFVMAREALGDTVARVLVASAEYVLDLMDGERPRGTLLLDAVKVARRGRAPQEGSGHLLDPAGQRSAGFVLRANYAVVCLDAASKLVFESFPAPDETARVMARKRTIATVTPLQTGGLLSRHRGLEVTFERSATPPERLRVVAGMVLCEAWLLERKRFGHRTGHDEGVDLDLRALFGLD
jgi:hypothetical protein